MFDWKYELQQCIDAACDPALDKDQREACALSAGRIILFALEDLCDMEYEYILLATGINRKTANKYRAKYLASIGRLLKANEQPHHPNCRCVFDEQEDNNG